MRHATAQKTGRKAGFLSLPSGVLFSLLAWVPAVSCGADWALETRFELDSYSPFARLLSLQDESPTILPSPHSKGWANARAETLLQRGPWLAQVGYHAQARLFANPDTQAVYREITEQGTLGPEARTLAYHASRIRLREAGVGYQHQHQQSGYTIGVRVLVKQLWLDDWQDNQGNGHLSALAADQTRQISLNYQRQGAGVQFDWPTRTERSDFSGWSGDLAIRVVGESEYGWELSGRDIHSRLHFQAQAATQLSSQGQLSNQDLINTGAATLTGQNQYVNVWQSLPSDWQLTLQTPEHGYQPWLEYRHAAGLQWTTLGLRGFSRGAGWQLGWIPAQRALAVAGQYGPLRIRVAADALNIHQAHALQIGISGHWPLN